MNDLNRIYNGFYSNRYNLSFKPYEDIDFSKRCFVFSGQGSFDFAIFAKIINNSSYCKSRFKSIDDLAEKYKLNKISDHLIGRSKIDNKDLLTLQIMNTLTLFSSQVVLAEFLEKLGINASISIAHSFGEYAALVHSGMVSFETAFDIVYMRETFLPTPHEKGLMIAVRDSVDNLKKLLEGQEVYFANANSNLQTVISIPNSSLDLVKKTLKEKRIPAQVLTHIVQPFHSPLLLDAQKLFLAYLEKLQVKLQEPKNDFLSSNDSVIYTKENYLSYNLPINISGQLINPIDFPKQINKIIERKIYNFLEIGPISSCEHFIKQIVKVPKFKTSGISYYLGDDVRDDSVIVNLNARQSELFKRFSQTIGEFTGYEVDTIAFTQKFQDDLGIDSLKKAEIILSFLETSQVQADDSFNLANFKNVGDVVDFVANAKTGVKKVKKSKIEANFKNYTEVLNEQELLYYPFLKPEVCFVKLDEIIKDFDTALVKAKKNIEVFEQDYNVNSIAVCFVVNNNLDLAKTNYETIENLYFEFTGFIDSLLQSTEKIIKNSHFVILGDSSNSVLASSLSLFLKSLKKELNTFNAKLIIVENFFEIDQLKNLIQKEVNDLFNQDVYYSDKLSRSVYSLVEKSFDAMIKPPTTKQVIVSIGGAKGIQFELLKGILSNLKSVDVYIIGRSSPNDIEVIKNLSVLKSIKATVFYTQLNVNDNNLFKDYLNTILIKHETIDFLINSAGVEFSKVFAEKNRLEISQELKSKIEPVMNLNSIDVSKIKNIVLFSSIVAYFGNGGQTSYTFSNRFLDLYAHKILKKNSETVVKIIHWPPWNGIGMTKNPGLMQRFKEILMSLLTTDIAQKFFNSILFNKKNESCYLINENDFFILDCLSYNIKEALYPFGKILDSASRVFEKDYSLATDPYLQDHKINNTAILPAANFIAHFYFAGYLHEKRPPIIKNFQIFNMILVTRELTRVRIQYKINFAKKKYKCFLDTKIKNATADLEFYPIAESSIYRNFVRTKKINGDSIYSSKCIEYGFCFQVIKEAYVDKDNRVEVVINNSLRNSLSDSNFFDLLITLFETLFQSIAMESIIKLKLLGVPTKIGEIITYNSSLVAEQLFCYPYDLQKINSNTVRASALMVDANGKKFLEFKDIEFSIIRTFPEVPLTYTLL